MMRGTKHGASYLLLLCNFVGISHVSALDVTTNEFWNLSARAAVLADDIFFEDRPVPPGAIVGVSERNLDKAMAWAESDVCWMVFRGTTRTIADWWQNGNLGKKSICNDASGKCCLVKQGFYDAYSKPSYEKKIEDSVRDCKAVCPQCEVVLTGHSQGGAIALVAGIVLADLSPAIITFAQPSTIAGGGCDSEDLIDESKFYRFVNTRTKGADFDYDLVPVVNSKSDRPGRVILLGEESDKVKYYENQPLFPYMTNFNTQAHFMGTYVVKVNELSLAASVSVDGFAEGHACNQDNECEKSVCLKHSCSAAAGRDGDACREDDDCVSRRCDRARLRFLSYGKCKAKLVNGEHCSGNSDCQSGNCGQLFQGCRLKFAMGLRECVCHS